MAVWTARQTLSFDFATSLRANELKILSFFSKPVVDSWKILSWYDDHQFSMFMQNLLYVVCIYREHQASSLSYIKEDQSSWFIGFNVVMM